MKINRDYSYILHNNPNYQFRDWTREDMCEFLELIKIRRSSLWRLVFTRPRPMLMFSNVMILLYIIMTHQIGNDGVKDLSDVLVGVMIALNYMYAKRNRDNARQELQKFKYQNIKYER